jgi:flagellar hook-associated protein 2
MQSQMRSILSATLPEATGKLTKLNQLGIAFQKDGTLSLDKTKLQGVIDANFSQISPLFAATGNSSDSLISYASATNKTKTGSYGVTVSQLASQGSWVGGASAGLEIKSGINDTLQVTLDGLSASITLPTGTYANAGALATDLQARINGNSTFSTAGSAATVTADSNGIISMTSGRYGSSSTISLSGNAVTDLLGGNGTAQAGLALVGTINSKNAITSGQTLTGIVGDDSEGLKIKIIGGTSGNRGIINYTQGFAYQLNQLGSSFVGDNGLILARTDGITGSMKKLDNDILRMQDRLTTLQKHYQTQFSALDTTMTKMNSTTSFLTQQLTALAKSA